MLPDLDRIPAAELEEAAQNFAYAALYCTIRVDIKKAQANKDLRLAEALKAAAKAIYVKMHPKARWDGTSHSGGTRPQNSPLHSE